MGNINVLIAGDHEIIRRALRTVLRSERTVRVVGEVASDEEAVTQTKYLKPDVVILVFSMLEHDRPEAIWRIHGANPRTHVLMLSIASSKAWALSAIARENVLKSDLACGSLMAALKVASNVGKYLSHEASGRFVNPPLHHAEPTRGALPHCLTARELQVARLLSCGKSSKEIGEVLSISVRTVETHRANIIRKLNVHSVKQLLRDASAHRLIGVRNGKELNQETNSTPLHDATTGTVPA